MKIKSELRKKNFLVYDCEKIHETEHNLFCRAVKSVVLNYSVIILFNGLAE